MAESRNFICNFSKPWCSCNLWFSCPLSLLKVFCGANGTFHEWHPAKKCRVSSHSKKGLNLCSFSKYKEFVSGLTKIEKVFFMYRYKMFYLWFGGGIEMLWNVGMFLVFVTIAVCNEMEAIVELSDKYAKSLRFVSAYFKNYCRHSKLKIFTSTSFTMCVSLCYHLNSG